MKVALPMLTALLQENVVELKFKRRIPKPGVPPTRRMLCTNCQQILASPEGRESLHYEATKLPPTFNPVTKNLIIAWDILVQDYRCISVENCEVISVIPGDETFWEYFSETLHEMTAAEKVTFMKV